MDGLSLEHGERPLHFIVGLPARALILVRD